MNPRGVGGFCGRCAEAPRKRRGSRSSLLWVMAHVAPHHPEVAPTAVAEEPMLIHHWAESGGRFAEVHAEANYNRGSRRTKCLIHCWAEGGGSLAESFDGSKTQPRKPKNQVLIHCRAEGGGSLAEGSDGRNAKTHILNPQRQSMRKDGGRYAEENKQKVRCFLKQVM